jgi:cell division protein FtsZ
MFEVDEAAKIITEYADPDANIIFGASINDNYTGEIKITVVATGFDEESNEKFSETATVTTKSPFGRKSIGNVPATAPRPGMQRPNPVATENDLDVPAFLRNKN